MAGNECGMLKVAELKLRLMQHGASTKGKKSELIDRLAAYDRYSHLGVSDAMDIPEDLPTDWPQDGFKQLVGDHRYEIPAIDDSQIRAYFVYRQGIDYEQVNDLKALQKGHAMFKSRQTKACSMSAYESGVFFSGIVKAAMKKKVFYNFRLKINQSGSILNSSCECPAGKGLHATCKHIATVIYTLQEFSRNGKLAIEKSGTERLQSFHRPRAEATSPVKITNLPGAVPVDLRDPRPLCYRNMAGYNDVVRNQVLNYCAQTGADLAMRYVYPKADVQAAALDHDYCITNLTQQRVNDALQITKENAQQLERATRGQSSSKVWAQERSWRVTASYFGTICHATERRDMVKLCKDVFNSKTIISAAILHGRTYEGTAKRQFEEKFNMKVKPCGLFVQPQLPFFGASPDGVVDNNCIVEIKCPYTGRNEKISASAYFPFLEVRDGQICLKRTSNYYYQIQGQMYLSERTFCYFIVYTFVDLFVQKVAKESAFFEESMLPLLLSFYREHYCKFVSAKL